MHCKKWINTDPQLPSQVARSIFVLKTTEVTQILYCSVYLSVDGLRMMCMCMYTLCKVYAFENSSYAHTCEDFVIIHTSSAPNLPFSPQKIHPLYCGKCITKYNVFSKSCTW